MNHIYKDKITKYKNQNICIQILKKKKNNNVYKSSKSDVSLPSSEDEDDTAMNS